LILQDFYESDFLIPVMAPPAIGLALSGMTKGSPASCEPLLSRTPSDRKWHTYSDCMHG